MSAALRALMAAVSAAYERKYGRPLVSALKAELEAAMAELLDEYVSDLRALSSATLPPSSVEEVCAIYLVSGASQLPPNVDVEFETVALRSNGEARRVLSQEGVGLAVDVAHQVFFEVGCGDAQDAARLLCRHGYQSISHIDLLLIKSNCTMSIELIPFSSETVKLNS